MTRHPASFICSVSPAWAKYPKVERFFAAELAKYLRVSTIQLQKLARERGIDRYVVIARSLHLKSTVMWVDRKGAELLIRHFRALQGELLAKGRDWDEQRAKRRARAR